MNLKKSVVAGAFVCLLLTLAGSAFAQTGASQISGLVKDASQALIPGAKLTLINIETAVSRTVLTDEQGAYRFVGVDPGLYRISAELPGFQRKTLDRAEIGTNVQARYDFTLEVGAVSTEVVVQSGQNGNQVLTEGASVGVALEAQNIRDLPIVSGNVLELLSVLPGYRENLLGTQFDTVGGLGLNSINTTINGMTTNSTRRSAEDLTFGGRSLLTTTTINPDLVGEIRLILAPVDAELGRGNSQVQITTRSGTNRYTGSVVWNIQNSAFSANTWAENSSANPTPTPWVNRHQLTASYGGPVIRNKTFFFVLYDQQIVRQRDRINATVLSDTARQGIFRYWSKYSNGNALSVPTYTGVTINATTGATTGTWPSVFLDGSPRRPEFEPTNSPTGGAPYTGQLHCFSVFGNVKLDPAGNVVPFGSDPNDCSYQVNGATQFGQIVTNTAWDPRRATFDRTGLISKIIQMMPRANYYGQGDGLNTASFQWLRGTKGSNTGNAPNGVVNTLSDQGNRKQFNIRIDENINTKHKVSANWQYQMDDSIDNISTWGTGISGSIHRRPQLLTITSTSSLTNTILNEGRVGLNKQLEQTAPAWNHPTNPDLRQAALDLLPQVTGSNGSEYTVLFSPATYNGYIGGGAVSCFLGACSATATDYWNTSPVYNFADTVTWSKGKHSFRGGVEFRFPRTRGYQFGAMPTASTGLLGTAPDYATAGSTTYNAQLPAMNATTRGNWATLSYFLNGSIAGASQNYWIDGQQDILNQAWKDVSTSPFQTRDQRSKEWNVFFKDDFRITRRLTLNLGLRYDYYGSPYLANGLTSALVGRGAGLYGVGRPEQASTTEELLSAWLRPGDLYLSGYGRDSVNTALAAGGVNPLVCSNTIAPQTGLEAYKPNCDPAFGTRLEFVGPGTDQPRKTLVPNSKAFGPALGLAYQLPWWGISMRGGWQRTHGQAGASSSLSLGQNNTAAGSLNSAQGLLQNHLNDASILAITGSGAGQLNRALNLEDLPVIIPIGPTPAIPQGRGFAANENSLAIPIVGRTLSLTDYTPDFDNPYTDNFTLSVTKQISRSFTLDTRYVGTFARKQRGSINLNLPTVYHNPELFDALERTRAGEDVQLFDYMLQGLNLNSNVSGYGAIGTCVAQPSGSTAPGLGQQGCTSAQVLQHGSAHLRRRFAADLADGDYLGIVNSLLGLGPASGNITGFQNVATLPSGVTAVQRTLRNGCDRIANGFTTANLSGAAVPARCFPENYFIANPQLSTATMNENFGRTNSHSFQATLTMRPRAGLSFSGTFQVDRQNQLSASTYADPLNRERDFVTFISNSPMGFRANGTFDLPFGPNKLFFGSTSGWVARVIEGWKTSFIFNTTSGPPRNLGGGSVGLYANNRPDIVGPWRNPDVNLRWEGQRGYLLGNPSPFVNFSDPQCSALPTTDSMGYTAFRAACTLEGLGGVVPAGTPGSIVNANGVSYIPLLQQAKPGTLGTAERNSMRGLPRWSLNANASKTFRLTESVTAQLRIDARNVMNHPFPSDTNPFDITNDTGFGVLTQKTGSPREFTAQLRVSF